MPVYPCDPEQSNRKTKHALHQLSLSEGRQCVLKPQPPTPSSSFLAMLVVSSLARLLNSCCTRSRLPPASYHNSAADGVIGSTTESTRTIVFWRPRSNFNLLNGRSGVFRMINRQQYPHTYLINETRMRRVREQRNVS